MSFKKSFLLFLVLSVSLSVTAQEVNTPTDLAEWVNPLMGTQSTFNLSNGNTYPSISLPWGMNCWMPQTGKMGDGWAYTYTSTHIRGFKQTHQPSPWINDYGQFSIMPVTKHVFDEEKRSSWFSHKSEIAKPYYYSVYLADHDVTTEIVPTERAAMFQMTFPSSDSSFVIIDAFDKGSYIKILPNEKKIVGYTTKNSGGVPANFKNYFVLYFDTPFTSSNTWHGKTLAKDTLEYKANHVGAMIGFKTKKGQKVRIRVASSFISPEQAELNLQRELGNDDFNTLQQKAKAIWNQQLSRLEVEGGSPEQVRTFYSCLYRIMLFPRKFHEVDAQNKTIHYSPYNGQIAEGYLYTDNGFWDTFRAVFPFFTLMYPELNSQIMQGLVNTYKESGWLPEWASPGHRDCMIGSNSASLIADSYLKGIRGYDIQTLYEAVLKNSEQEGPLSSVGRKGVSYYNKLGYVPYNVGINENAARTLEYAYADFTISQLAQALQKPKADVQKFTKRAQNYRNLFDPQTKLMRGKNQDGKFQQPFNPFKWGDAFTEGNSWHYTWSVFHDVQGLIGLMGGQKTFVSMLDSVFTMPPVFDDSYYGFPIHEIREMQIMNMGQYAHGNQPIQHMVYLYNYAGAGWKAQSRLREIMNKMYKPTPDGYCGDEDNGQTSAWYVFSAMGFYPVCPGTQEYVLGSPLFRKVSMHLENGKTFTIEAPGNSDNNVYIQNCQLNGQEYNNTFIKHSDILQGGTLKLDMSNTPNQQRGTKPEQLPFSVSAKK
ncbi:GH92 family glycosyl hydrolase [Cytophagaceae bacterium DM2B3-1]|uniref:GH92 family glycosyl hydrolase n=1 Tax=Xanthocytophaga flava TaxID=3048013 RepID=A0ABT7CLM1_9BACT|nr:GH92 family glycosyl hydrolase [Xanthocytophaga flavus]MDJ1469623.1 GH92 family glycosyl hydrolase [Xanthocytophaga flavus]MDJ1493569.1 GH92 family glycosyl hydrolase [Xanthocytophaga flavus]